MRLNLTGPGTAPGRHFSGSTPHAGGCRPVGRQGQAVR
jgi:hypothetical protein